LSECSHPSESVEVRKFIPTFGGVPTFRRQCLECCAVVDRDELDPVDLPGGVLACDVMLSKFERKKRTATGFGGRGNSKSRNLGKFYRSSKWRKQRDRIINRDRYRCADCGAPATCAAHIRYSDPIESTPDSDIKASCDECNQKEREQRITRGVLGG